VAPGDLIFCLFDLDETPRTIGLSNYEGMVTGAYDVFECSESTDPRFIYYFYLHIDSFKGLRPFYTGLRKVVRPPTFMSIKFALPPAEEQCAICSFLDVEIAKIDALVAEQQHLIELLKEKRQAVISRAVTKGLTPNAPMKDSGIEWVGDVPKHWEVSRIKRLAVMISKGTTPTTVGREFEDSGVRFIKAENIREGRVEPEPEVFISEETHMLLARSSLVAGDILAVIAGATTGRSAVLDQNLLPANTNQAVAFVRLHEPYRAPFVNHWLSTESVQRAVLLNSVQSAQPNLSMEDLGNLPVLVPPKCEIETLLQYIRDKCGDLAKLISDAENCIALLQERRTALISAAVTGKVDVRGMAKGQSA
jgi:type I restriction enzyme, S subunit